MNRKFSINADKLLVKPLGYLLMTIVTVMSTVPFIWVFLSSFKTNREIFNNPIALPSQWTFASYREAIRLSNLHLVYLNSIIISVCATVAAVIIFALMAYVLARKVLPGSKIIFAILISSILIPSNALIQPIYSTIQSLNLYDTRTGLILIYTAFGLPVSLFVMKNYFQNLPREMEEAAEIDGAGFATIFLRIMLPLAKPAVACALTLIFINNWNEFMYAYLMTTTRASRTLPVAIRYFVSEFAFDHSAMFAAVMMIAVPSMTAYFVMQNQIMESLVTGAVKG